MSKRTQAVVDEAHENVRKDRKKLEAFIDAIEKVLSSDITDDPLSKLGAAEVVTKLVDGLTRSNMQLVELAKLLVKRDIEASSEDDLDGNDVSGLFDEIGNGFSREEGDDN